MKRRSLFKLPDYHIIIIIKSASSPLILGLCSFDRAHDWPIVNVIEADRERAMHSAQSFEDEDN
jgi:hypothetical protein